MDIEALKKKFSYDPESGVLVRLVASSGAGGGVGPCGYINPQGYLEVSFQSKTHLVHRIVFALMGETVPAIVDHINRNRSDNRWSNLRPSTAKLNRLNQKSLGVQRNGRMWVARKGRGVLISHSCFGVVAKAHQELKRQSIAAELLRV